MSVLRLESATAMMLPPRPPSPPSGPPRGTNFARRNEADPSPPLPATTSILASSKNFISGDSPSALFSSPRNEKAPPERRGSFVFRRASGLRRLHRHGGLLLRAVLAVLHLAGDEREERVVLADADVRAGV